MLEDQTSPTLDPTLLDEARALGIDVVSVAETGLRRAIGDAKGQRWREENAEAMRDYNDWIAKNGLPLAKYRQF